jgi:hypothetical protein
LFATISAYSVGLVSDSPPMCSTTAAGSYHVAQPRSAARRQYSVSSL